MIKYSSCHKVAVEEFPEIPHYVCPKCAQPCGVVEIPASQQPEYSLNCSQCGGVYLSSEGFPKLQFCPKCLGSLYPSQQPDASPDQPDSERLILITTFSDTGFNEAKHLSFGSDYSLYCKGMVEGARQQQKADQIQRDLTASLKDGEIRELKAVADAQTDLAEKAITKVAELQADHKAEVERIFTEIGSVIGGSRPLNCNNVFRTIKDKYLVFTVKITRKEFLKLPIEARRRIISEQCAEMCQQLDSDPKEMHKMMD